VPSIRPILCCCLLALFALPAAAQQNWLDTTIEISVLIDAGDYDAAAALGTALIVSAASEFGDESQQLAESHMVVAEAHMANRDFIAAEDSLILAIQIYERIEGPLSTALISTYSDLGDAYFAGEEYELAGRAYTEARGISRRNYGLENIIQAPLVYKEANVVEALGNVQEASELQVEAVQIIQRYYGADSANSLVALYGLANWLSAHEYYLPAGQQFSAAANLLRYGLDGDDLEVISLLMLSAANYRLGARSFVTSGSDIPRRPSELLSALSIALDLEDEQLLLQAEIWRDIGDWYVALVDRPQILGAYQRAIELLDEIENGDQIFEEWFGVTVPVYQPSLRGREISTDEDAPRGWVDLEFVVTEHGTTDKIDVIASSPEGLMDRDARRQVDNSRFRPLIEDGQIVPVVRTFRVEYRYDPSFVEE